MSGRESKSAGTAALLGVPAGQVQLHHLRWDGIKRSAAFNLQTQVKVLKDGGENSSATKQTVQRLLFTVYCVLHNSPAKHCKVPSTTVPTSPSQRVRDGRGGEA